jgi:hypothetical protein
LYVPSAFWVVSWPPVAGAKGRSLPHLGHVAGTVSIFSVSPAVPQFEHLVAVAGLTVEQEWQTQTF